MTLFGEKVLISTRCNSGLMPNLIEKSWTDSTVFEVNYLEIGEGGGPLPLAFQYMILLI
jgi:hypothetical protein